MNIELERSGLVRSLLTWYRREGRSLPWRAPRGTRPDPYRVWLSEIMLQQTTVAAVTPYYARFVERWPDVEALAAAELDEVLHAWQGLGYYARARNLHRCARLVSAELDGRFPGDEGALRALPGIGAYTAAAIAAIAFGKRAVVVDGNVERVMARLFGIESPLPGAKAALRELAEGLTPERRAGDYAQAVMDLGATVCTPRRPACDVCPWRAPCRARRAGKAETLPRRAPSAPRPLRTGVAFWATRADGRVLLRRRPERGLLGGLMEVPTTPWRATPWSGADARAHAPVAAEWRPLDGVVGHTFTHFHLELSVMAAAWEGESAEGVWQPIAALDAVALPTVMRKVARHALKALNGGGNADASIG